MSPVAGHGPGFPGSLEEETLAAGLNLRPSKTYAQKAELLNLRLNRELLCTVINSRLFLRVVVFRLIEASY